MSEMVDRAALAMANVDSRKLDLPEMGSMEEFRFDAEREHYRELARAAIESMRYPTDAMRQYCGPFATGDMSLNQWPYIISVALK